VLWEIAAEVYKVERLGQFADKAAATLADLAGSGVPKAQLKIGGRLQELVRVTHGSENNYRSEGTADLRSVPFDREGGVVGDREGR
jgi:hypothetical protein